MHPGYFLSLQFISPLDLVRVLLKEVVIKIYRLLIVKSVPVHSWLLSILKTLSENLKPVGTSHPVHPPVYRKIGKRYTKQYRDRFVQYFPTLLAEITRLHGWDCDHLKEVCIATCMGFLSMNTILLLTVPLFVDD